MAALLIAVLLAACSDEPDHGATTPSTTISPQPSTPVAATISPSPTLEPSPSPTATPAAGRTLLALGDSVTFGVGIADPEMQAFPALVAEALDAEPHVIAVPGETAAGFLDRHADRAEDAVRELAGRLEVVTIGLGANEILRIRRHPACLEDRASEECQRIANEAAEEAAAALDAVVARVADAAAESGSDAAIVLLAYYNPDVEPVAASTIVGVDGVVACDPSDPSPGLNDRIACVAERRGTLLVDLYTAFLGREAELTGIGRGDVHPTAEGHRVIAAAILATIEAAR